MSEAESEGETAAVSGTIMETGENPTVPSAAQTHTVYVEEEDGDHTADHQTQVDICSDQEPQPSSPSDRVGQDRFSGQEPVVDDVGNSTATGEPHLRQFNSLSI